jgi:3-oxoadipate enol-lactonase
MPQIGANSITINYEIAGQGDPLRLIMGFGMPGAAWASMIPFFAGFQCIYFDSCGTGLYDKPYGLYTIADMAEDASALIRGLGARQFTASRWAG